MMSIFKAARYRQKQYHSTLHTRYGTKRKISILFTTMLLALLPPIGLNADRPVRPNNRNAKLDLSSPYALIQTHFMLLSPGNKSLRNARALFMYQETYPGESQDIAIRLKQLLTLHSINIETITHNENYIDPVVNEHRYILSKKLPLVYLIKDGEEWRYSQDTVLFIKQYEAHFKLDEFFQTFLPKPFCQKKILDLFVWQYMGLLGLVIIIWLIHKMTPYFFRYMVYRFLDGPQKRLLNIERLSFILMAALLLKLVFPMLELSDSNFFANNILTSSISFLLMYLSYECVGIIQQRIKASKRQSKFTIHVLPIYSMLAKIIVILCGVIKTIDNFGIDTGSLVQVLSFSTLGLGLAAQDTIKNLFGSLVIVMTRPFDIGDDIASGPIRGIVEDIGLRATLLRTREGSLVYIPNAKLTDIPIDNFGRRNLRLIHLEIPLNYSIPLDVLSKFVRGLRAITKRQSFVIQDRTELYLDNMDKDGLVIILRLFLDTPEAKTERKCKHSVISLILQMAHYFELRLGKIRNMAHIKESSELEEQPLTKTEIENILEEAHDEG